MHSGGLALALLGACGTAPDAPAGPFVAVPLARMAEVAGTLSLPTSAEPPPRTDIAVPGPWRLVGVVGGVASWQAALPVRPRSLFFHRAPEDMALLGRAGKKREKLIYNADSTGFARAGSWRFSAKTLVVRRPASAGPPGPDDYVLTYGRALARARARHAAESGLSPKDFVFRSAQVGDTTRRGLVLPAGGEVGWTVDVPPGAVLDFEALRLPPEAGLPPAGAAAVRVWVDGRDAVPLGVAPLVDAAPGRFRFGLGPWAGETVGLRFTVDPLGSPAGDTVLVGDPIVFVPQPAPPRVVLVFIDTLRPDRMSVYGAAQDTTPFLARWAAEEATVFTEARSVAPWTLPSARTMLTGAQPERWGSVAPLQDRFADAGWATAFIAGNIYLSSTFEMAAGWTSHRILNWPNADLQVDRALSFLGAHADRPAFLVLHLMDAHLPYREPLRWRWRFAGRRPDVFRLDAIQRTDVMRRGGLDDAAKDWVRGRYDNAIAFVDAELERFFGALPPDTVVVLASDHGEEFWDHGGFEHGHSLYDELLRVPLIVKAPGLAGGRSDLPVSLLDVAPTLAVAAGLDTGGMEGVPLQEMADEPRFRQRPQGFGRPLYGDRRWGALAGTVKWTSHKGKDLLTDLAVDRGEDAPRVGDATAHAAALERALGLPVRRAIRVAPARAAGAGDLRARLRVPGGVEAAFAADDPTEQSELTVAVEGEWVDAVWAGGRPGVRELYLVPAAGVEAGWPGLEAAFESVKPAATASLSPDPARAAPPPGSGAAAATLRVGSRAVTFTEAWVPLPGAARGLQGFDEEVAGELEELGYLRKDEDDARAGGPGR